MVIEKRKDVANHVQRNDVRTCDYDSVRRVLDSWQAARLPLSWTVLVSSARNVWRKILTITLVEHDIYDKRFTS